MAWKEWEAGKRVADSRWRQVVCVPFVLFVPLFDYVKWPWEAIREMGLWMDIRSYWGIIVNFVRVITVYDYVRKCFYRCALKYVVVKWHDVWDVL